ncbi:MAG: hypothetical protein ACRC62_26815 [Microcoleus sp.]
MFIVRQLSSYIYLSGGMGEFYAKFANFFRCEAANSCCTVDRVLLQDDKFCN